MFEVNENNRYECGEGIIKSESLKSCGQLNYPGPRFWPFQPLAVEYDQLVCFIFIGQVEKLQEPLVRNSQCCIVA